MHEHEHNDVNAMSQRRFFTVTILNSLITLIEFLGEFFQEVCHYYQMLFIISRILHQ